MKPSRSARDEIQNLVESSVQFETISASNEQKESIKFAKRAAFICLLPWVFYERTQSKLIEHMNIKIITAKNTADGGPLVK